SAPVSHNVKWDGGRVKNPGGNEIISSGATKNVKLNADKQPIAISCNIHPWMKGWIRVFDHPYFAVTDENGKFEIKNAPAGKLKVVYWQEKVGYKGGKEGRFGDQIDATGPTTELKPVIFDVTPAK